MQMFVIGASVVVVFAMGVCGAQAADKFNVRDHGAIPDDGKPDTQAVVAALAAAQKAGGGVVFFPAGTYEVDHIHALDGSPYQDGKGMAIKKTHFQGAGREASVVKSIATPGRYIFTFTGAEDLKFSDIAFDANGSRSYGGIRFYGCKRLTIDNTRYFDSDVPARDNPPRAEVTDIYPYILARSDSLNEDVAITNNLIEDLQLEIDCLRRAKITGNTILRPVSTAGIGIFSLQFNPMEGEDICAEDVEISHNVIHDISLARVGIAVHLDPPMHNDQSPLTNIVFRNIHILGNTIEIIRDGVGNSHAIKLGQVDYSRATSGVKYDGIRIEDNKIIVHAGTDVREDSVIALMPSRPTVEGGDFRFENTTIKNNLFQYSGSKHLIDARGRGKNFVEEGNRKEPAPTTQKAKGK